MNWNDDYVHIDVIPPECTTDDEQMEQIVNEIARLGALVGAERVECTFFFNNDCANVIDLKGADERLIDIMNYIHKNYLTVTLEELANKYHLSEPYLSKYIKEKSGKTFGENLQNIRMKRAKSLLKNSTMTVENIAYAVGYQNVEHFDRIFKKRFEMTPIQYRNSKI